MHCPLFFPGSLWTWCRSGKWKSYNLWSLEYIWKIHSSMNVFILYLHPLLLIPLLQIQPLVQRVVHTQDALEGSLGFKFTFCLLRSCTQETGYMGYVRCGTNLNFTLDPDYCSFCYWSRFVLLLPVILLSCHSELHFCPCRGCSC